MIAYEFYHQKPNGCHLIGILPERRKNPERITDEAIMEWIKKVLGDHGDISNIYFVRVSLNGFKNEKRTETPEILFTDGGKHEKDPPYR